MVEGARLESVYTVKLYQGFESLSLRHIKNMKRILFLFKSSASINTVLFFLYKKFLNIFLKREIKRFKLNNRIFLKEKKLHVIIFL